MVVLSVAMGPGLECKLHQRLPHLGLVHRGSAAWCQGTKFGLSQTWVPVMASWLTK